MSQSRPGRARAGGVQNQQGEPLTNFIIPNVSPQRTLIQANQQQMKNHDAPLSRGPTKSRDKDCGPKVQFLHSSSQKELDAPLKHLMNSSLIKTQRSAYNSRGRLAVTSSHQQLEVSQMESQSINPINMSTGNRSPFSSRAAPEKVSQPEVMTQSMKLTSAATPNSKPQASQSSANKHNFSLRESNESLRIHNSLQTSKTAQKLFQKSRENSVRKELDEDFKKGIQITNQNSTKLSRHQGVRQSAETNGPLSPNQLTQSQLSVNFPQASKFKTARNGPSHAATEEKILMGCTVLQEPKQPPSEHDQFGPYSGEVDPHQLPLKSPGYDQKSELLDKKGQYTNSLLQSYDLASHMRPNMLLTPGSQAHNVSSFSNHMQLINSNLQNKVCNSLEEAQPILRLCLTNIYPSSSNLTQFNSLLSDNDIDQNLICPACKFIVVNPVECQACQYIICFHCAQAQGMTCSDENCSSRFSDQPGKIHKLFRVMLGQLEFRCPNHGAGCQMILKYDQLQSHLQTECENRDKPCPNHCSPELKFNQAALKEHLLQCPNEIVACSECQTSILRKDLEAHFEHKCPKYRVKCPRCEMLDFKQNFLRGLHDCFSIESSCKRAPPEEDILRSTRGYREAPSAEETVRLRDSLAATEQRLEDIRGDYESLRTQYGKLEEDFSQIDQIVIPEIFKMFDNMSECVTQKDKAVEELQAKVSALESENDKFKKKFKKQTDDYECLLGTLNVKLDEKVLELKQNQEKEISNIKRMMLSHLQSDLPLQIPQGGGRLSQNRAQVSIRGPPRHQPVPTLNLRQEETEAQDICQDNGGVPRGAEEINLEEDENEEELEDFVPFLSSTDNELTDLNTDFNTDRPGTVAGQGMESLVGSQSTYRSRQLHTQAKPVAQLHSAREEMKIENQDEMSQPDTQQRRTEFEREVRQNVKDRMGSDLKVEDDVSFDNESQPSDGQPTIGDPEVSLPIDPPSAAIPANNDSFNNDLEADIVDRNPPTLGVEPEVERQANPSRPANQFISVLDESSDLDQIQNNNLPGSIHDDAVGSSSCAHHTISTSSLTVGMGSSSVLPSAPPERAERASGEQSRMSHSQQSYIVLQHYAAAHIAGAKHPFDSQPSQQQYILEEASQVQASLDGESSDQSQFKRAPQTDRGHQRDDGSDPYQMSQLQKTGRADSGRQRSLQGSSTQLKKMNHQTAINIINGSQASITQPVNSSREEDASLVSKNMISTDKREDVPSSLGTQPRIGLQETSVEEEKLLEEEQSELIKNIKQETQDVINQIVNNKNRLQQQDSQGGEEECNETETEEIQNHLQAFQQYQNGGLADERPQMMAGLESDLETIFETDLESNYITTARTNLSTKKFLAQAGISNPSGSQGKAEVPSGDEQHTQERLNQILMSQFSPIAHSGDNPGSINRNSNTNFKRQKGSSTKKDMQARGHETTLEDMVSPSQDNTDTSQSLLISNRSHQVQQVKSTSQKPSVNPSEMVSPKLLRQHLEANAQKVKTPYNTAQSQLSSQGRPNQQCVLSHTELEKLSKRRTVENEDRIQAYSEKVARGGPNKSSSGKKKQVPLLKPGHRQETIQEEDIEEDVQMSQGIHRAESRGGEGSRMMAEYFQRQPVYPEEQWAGQEDDYSQTVGHFQNLQGKFKQQIEEEMEQLAQQEQQNYFQFGGMATESEFTEGEDLEQPPQIFQK